MATGISEHLEAVIADLAGEEVTIVEIIARLGNRAHGLAILLFALPCTLPMPYGIPTAFGTAILLVSLQLLLWPGRSLWLPRFLGARTIARADLQRMLDKALPLVLRLERLTHPRHEWAAGALGRTITAILCAVCGFTMLLPIPFIGNIPPAIAATALAVGLLQRDGLFLMAGFVLFSAAMAILAAAWWGILNGVT
ncbi:Uncharacterized conserved protein [Ruegeria intermedia]|uniref:Uncharacterized conserved protein n=1 Tax=Ruegeria intermedia TaxID=996115 RepID=A0A1M5C182_9RHOB|nr:exopolysaccharide biosynthesis protein [Ruegeria intermedia]SHF48420.1 Uncharacterized conserved protein [Ruegeria intermedia]